MIMMTGEFKRNIKVEVLAQSKYRLFFFFSSLNEQVPARRAAPHCVTVVSYAACQGGLIVDDSS
jgi:hypothetical protein